MLHGVVHVPRHAPVPPSQMLATGDPDTLPMQSALLEHARRQCPATHFVYVPSSQSPSVSHVQ